MWFILQMCVRSFTTSITLNLGNKRCHYSESTLLILVLSGRFVKGVLGSHFETKNELPSWITSFALFWFRWDHVRSILSPWKCRYRHHILLSIGLTENVIARKWLFGGHFEKNSCHFGYLYLHWFDQAGAMWNQFFHYENMGVDTIIVLLLVLLITLLPETEYLAAILKKSAANLDIFICIDLIKIGPCKIKS